MSQKPLFTLEDLLPILPHRPPFLFVDRVLKLDPYKSIVAERLLRPEEPQFAGHFPGRPIMPGVLVGEALAQTSGLLLGLSDRLTRAQPPAEPRMLVLAATQLKFTHPAAPGDLLRLEAAGGRSLGALFRFEVEAAVGRQAVATGSLTLAQISGPPITGQ